MVKQDWGSVNAFIPPGCRRDGEGRGGGGGGGGRGSGVGGGGNHEGTRDRENGGS